MEDGDSMTLEEFQYIKRAVEALESPETTPMAQRKILRTMEQICGKNATEIERNLVDSLDERLYNTNIY
jgi:hypothetical protein